MYDLIITIDNTSKQLTAFKAPAEAMNTTKQSTPCYLYAKYGASVLMYTTLFVLYICPYIQVSTPMTEVCTELPA